MEKIKAFFTSTFKNIGRVSLETLILVGLGFVFFNGFYENLSNPVQLILLKAILVSGGLYHAHLVGKFFIPVKVDWNQRLTQQKGAYFARISLYIIVPICYSIGA